MAKTNPLLQQDPYWGHRARSYRAPAMSQAEKTLPGSKKGFIPL